MVLLNSGGQPQLRSSATCLCQVEAKEKAKRSDLPALYKERDQIKKDIGEIRDEQRCALVSSS